MLIQPRLRDYFSLASQQEAISNETHTIPVQSPYSIFLHQIPKVATAATGIVTNAWVSVAQAALYLTVEIETSTGVWETATLTDTTPGVLEAQVQLANSLFPYSTQIFFAAAYAGKAVRVSYTGFGSTPLARYLTRLFVGLESVLNTSLPQMIDMATYNGGRMDGQGTATTEVLVTPSSLLLPGASVPFPGVTLDFGSGGNVEVSAFTNANYWKRCLVYVAYSGGWSYSLDESAEAASQGALITPTDDVTKTLLGVVDVQNDGTTGSAGHVTAIPASRITSQVRVSSGGVLQSHTLRVYGSPGAGELDVPFAPHAAGELVTFGIYLDDSGSAGQTRIDVKLCSSSDRAGTSVFTSSATQAIITASGQEELDVCSGADFATTAFTANNWFRFTAEEWATDAADIQVTLYYRLSPF